MDYQVQLNDGRAITLHNASIDAGTFTEQLNEPQTVFVNLAGVIVNKHLIASIIPVTPETPETPETLEEA